MASNEPMRTPRGTAIAEASDSAYVKLMKQADAFEELIEAYDGSAAASEEIAQATVDYYNALVNVIAGIRQLRESIGEMFDRTIEEMMLETMSDADKGSYYANQIDLLAGQLSTATDPAEIERLTSQLALISRLGQRAIGLDLVNGFIRAFGGGLRQNRRESRGAGQRFDLRRRERALIDA